MLQFPVGPHVYRVRLVKGFIELDDGRICYGACSTAERRIYISDALSPEKRVTTFWHEFGHAAKRELDISGATYLGEEPLCELIALAMSPVCASTIARVRRYLMRGVAHHYFRPFG